MDFISPDIATLNLTKFMHEALLEAERAGRAGELPIGAVVVISGERLWQDYKRPSCSQPSNLARYA